MSGKSRLLSLLGTFVLSEREVRGVRALSPSFRLIELAPPAGAQKPWQPGDKVQVLLEGEDEVRTYTPVAWGPDGAMALVAFVHGPTPASRWAQRIRTGERLRFIPPARSLTMPEGDITLVGDETSLALAAGYTRARPGRVRTLLEIDERTSLDEVPRELGLEAATIVRRPAGAAHGSALAKHLDDVRGPVGLTGGGALLQRARDVLRARGVQDLKSKAYWVEGRRGID